MRNILYFLMMLLFSVSCNKEKSIESKELASGEKEQYLKLGDSLSTVAQKVLLSNVSEQISQNGAERAVGFCHENAIKLTDSVSGVLSYKISRVTDKPRNPKNSLKTTMDRQAWKLLMENLSSKEAPKHILLQEGQEIMYYKAIPIGMPTCLMCHGKTDTDITSETLKIINYKYPQDQAVDYTMGELRGLWKVKIDKR